MSEIKLEDFLPNDMPSDMPSPTKDIDITTHTTLTSTTKYMIIPDLHIWDKNFRGRKDYVGEVKQYVDEIIEKAKIERLSCDKLIAIFAGDIFHKGFKDTEEFGYWFNFFLDIREIFDEVFSVLGNHEITYYKNNPFWHMVRELETNDLKRMTNKVYTPKGKLPLIRVVDKIEDGEWTIHLAHFTCKPLAEGTKNIGIFHSSIIDNTIANTLKEKYNRDPLTEYIDHSYVKDNNPFKNMEYAFVAHMHKAFGLFTIESNEGSPTTTKTRLRYMASIGRTNEVEVDNNDLLRVIPVLEIKDGTTCTLKELEIKLQSREQSLVLSEIEENKIKAKATKEIKILKQYTDTVSDPITDLKHLVRDDEVMYSLLDASLNNYTPNAIINAREYILRGVNYDELERQVRELSSKEEHIREGEIPIRQ